MSREALYETFGIIEGAIKDVAAMLGLSTKMRDDAFTMLPLHYRGLDPQFHLSVIHPDGRDLTFMVVARVGQLYIVPDGDGDDDDGFAPHPWRAAVMEELAVKLQPTFPRLAEHLRTVATDVHTSSRPVGMWAEEHNA